MELMVNDYDGSPIVYDCDECGDERRAVKPDPEGHGDWSYILECGHLVFGWVGV